MRLDGHAIEVRLCAEDERFTPHAGTVRRFAPPPASAGLRFDHALAAGTEVTPHYDAMLGKLIAHAPTRDEAIDRLGHALAQLQVLGLPTNRAFLAASLRHPVFRAGAALIPFLAEHGDAIREALRPPPDAERVAALAVAFAGQAPAEALPLPFAREQRLRHGSDEQAPVIALQLQERGRREVTLAQGGHQALARWSDWSPEGATLTLDGRQWHAALVRTDMGADAPGGLPCWHVQVTGTDAGTDGSAAAAWECRLEAHTHAPARQAVSAASARELRAPFNGRLVAVAVEPGQAVTRGMPLLVVESMKIEHQLASPRDGVIGAVHAAAGQQVAPGQPLISFADEAPTERATP